MTDPLFFRPTQVSEGGTATFTVSASANLASAIAVGYSMAGKARLGTDYTLTPSGSVTIPAGQSSATITLHALIDALTEKNEAVKIKLTKRAGYKLSAAKTATVTILNGP